MEPIKFSPTDGLSYNPNDSVYWDKQALRKEINRTFEICHSCRMCFKYCDAFPAIFKLIDNDNREIKDFTDHHIRNIADECFQCKICYFKCPYTKDDNHEFDLDFPRLIMRFKANEAKDKGLSVREKFLGDPDFLGKVGCNTSAIANVANAFRPNRILMEKFLGIHRDKILPPFASQKFSEWYKKNREKYLVSEEQAIDKVVLFHTCFGNYNNPQIARDALYVLWKNKVHVTVPEVSCCGMPALESGNLSMARKGAIRNYEVLMPLIEDGFKVIVLNPTCSLTMKDEYPIILENRYTQEALQKFRAAVFDTNEYLFQLKQSDQFNRDFKSTPGKIAYHIPCHLRAQNIGYRSRDMMKTIAQTSFVLVDECCGHNGIWAMKKEHFADSMRIGAKAFDKIKGSEHDIVATDCPLAAVQLEQGTGERILHTIQVLARAYDEDGFETKISQ